MGNILVKTTKQGYDEGGVLAAIVGLFANDCTYLRYNVWCCCDSDGTLERMSRCSVSGNTRNNFLADVGHISVVGYFD